MSTQKQQIVQPRRATLVMSIESYGVVFAIRDMKTRLLVDINGEPNEWVMLKQEFIIFDSGEESSSEVMTRLVVFAQAHGYDLGFGGGDNRSGLAVTTDSPSQGGPGEFATIEQAPQVLVACAM